MPDSNTTKFGNILPDIKMPIYAEISERWAVVNGIVYFFWRTNKEVKVLNSLSTNYEERSPQRSDILLDTKYKNIEHLINLLNSLDEKTIIHDSKNQKKMSSQSLSS
ncbi:1188_t:CDS:1 [Cetraspora pellucida]|uniref:1188_t:CDS:1 n=1 Tax=Cetraspora pellucida TaxID=1433469 RepID=A0ACA9L573_9GLOM|nr:1188_t:CDS:1 [Cetraspora pellucida]